jgi:hypothetical protein
MLTYRQLLLNCNRNVLNKILFEKTLKDLSYKEAALEELELKAAATGQAYNRVIDSMLSKPIKWAEFSIILDLQEEAMYDEKTFENTGEKYKYIGVHYYNSSAKKLPEDADSEDANDLKYHKFTGFGLCSWGDYVDSDVVVTPEVVIHLNGENFYEKVAAEILWEQTFYGFEESEALAFKEELNKRVDDVINGKTDLFELDLETMEFKKIKKNPYKKKASKKKKK